MANIKKYYRINQHINAAEVRVVAEDGKQLGIMPLGEAIKLATSKDKDLVEVADRAKPPVCKIINFTKFKYLQQKKLAEDKKKSKDKSIKEIRLTPFIAKGDLQNRTKKALEFLTAGHRVKITVKFIGRQMTRKEFGYNLLKQVVESLSQIGKPDGEPKLVGRRLNQIINPIKKN